MRGRRGSSCASQTPFLFLSSLVLMPHCFPRFLFSSGVRQCLSAGAWRQRVPLFPPPISLVAFVFSWRVMLFFPHLSPFVSLVIVRLPAGHWSPALPSLPSSQSLPSPPLPCSRARTDVFSVDLPSELCALSRGEENVHWFLGFPEPCVPPRARGGARAVCF